MAKISQIETFPLFLSKEEAADSYASDSAVEHRGYMVKPPWRSLYSPGYETLMVKITTDSGEFGWGEALAPVAPEVAAAIVDRLLTPLLLGENPQCVPVLWHRMSESMRERGHLLGHQADAMAAVDIALWDLRGKLESRSITELLGGSFTNPVPTYVSGLRGTTDAERAERAATMAERGVCRFKLHLGSGIDEDLATFDAVREAAPAAKIAVDAHWSYSLGDARTLGLELDRRRAWFFEAPLAPEDVKGHRDLAVALATPIAVGEAMRSRFEFADWLSQRAVQIVQPDIGRTGITEGMAIAGIADAFHARVAPHHSAALGVAMAAGIHVAAASQASLVFEYQPNTLPVANSILSEKLEVKANGDFHLPTTPGLGVTVDETKVRLLTRQN
ncbi:mandelate racemase/muconate lactonizing enzyme family protein [Subtercola lobariae]|uniref:Enolase n=1 Tax=Subtercola lobariae TaxID=1588641 RepID=A0A917BJ83_9MICO|nr:mandelate racemase/muconate lactonizing enzyme family protein [Subtercola lobariae]GGF41797.1 enolase [Subtercola lobariae]